MESFDTSNEITYNTKKFVSLDAEGFFHKLHGRSIVYECGFDPDAIFENEFWDIVDLYGWMEFSVQSQRLAVPSAVHEFFASLKFSEEDKVYVIGREIEISSSVISKYYNVPFVANDEIELLDNRNFKGVNIDSIMLYLIEERGEWEREKAFRPTLDTMSQHRRLDVTTWRAKWRKCKIAFDVAALSKGFTTYP
ncbi:hypothetical protein Godav_024590 [Gossypium davidsonii]|uniref:Uncharacterized protein n=1 Tax=Gossypium davidsonii TaxID=34287 RepID=A0A7J8TJY1_GOSDV|nr:hypothetical protein [Gossypium davidsonii]